MNEPKIPNESIAKHTVQGSAYSVAASAVTITLGIIRTYLMVYFLLPEEIGLAALGLFYVDMLRQLSSIGLSSAMVHKTDPTEEDQHSYFTFEILMGIGGLLLASLAAPIIAPFYPGYKNLEWIIWAYVGISAFSMLNFTQLTFLNRRLAFDKIAILNITGAVANTIVGPGMAALGFGVWAILGGLGAGIFARFLVLHIGLRPYKPELAWNHRSIRWFWEYGKKFWLGSNLIYFIENFDDFWVGTSLGASSLGIYNKAYEFSQYPRRVIANPIIAVFFPTFAHLQQERKRLSKAFYRATSLMIRAGALLSLLTVLTAPELFALFLPDVWQPMRLTFQLMIVFSFLDPISLSAQSLLMATGQPQLVTKARAFQALVFIPAVIAGEALMGINGVALATDLMILVGIVLLYHGVRQVVDFSARKMWLWPTAGMTLIVLIISSLGSWLSNFPPQTSLLIKAGLISSLYTIILAVFEKERLVEGVNLVQNLINKNDNSS